MKQYKIESKTLKDAGIEAKEGVKVKLELKDGTQPVATITKVEKESVVVTVE